MAPHRRESGPEKRDMKTALVEREPAVPTDGQGRKVGPSPQQAHNRAWGPEEVGRGGVRQACHVGFATIPHLQPAKRQVVARQLEFLGNFRSVRGAGK